MAPLSSLLWALCVSIAMVQAIDYAGVNIAGFDFGCVPSGECTLGSQATTMNPPAKDQMSHFVSKGLNTFRLPVGW